MCDGKRGVCVYVSCMAFTNHIANVRALLATLLSYSCDFCLRSMQFWSTVFSRGRYKKH